MIKVVIKKSYNKKTCIKLIIMQIRKVKREESSHFFFFFYYCKLQIHKNE